jgi:hypothetical protein
MADIPGPSHRRIGKTCCKRHAARKEKAPGSNVVPGGQRTSHLFRERLDDCTTQHPCGVSGPVSISSHRLVDETTVSFLAGRHRSAVRRNVAGTFPMQTRPRGCRVSTPISCSRNGKAELSGNSLATAHSCRRGGRIWHSPETVKCGFPCPKTTRADTDDILQTLTWIPPPRPHVASHRPVLCPGCGQG